MLPSNLEAEQGLLGAVITVNEYFHTLEASVNDKWFYEPCHGAIWRVFQKTIGKGMALNGTILTERMAIYSSFAELGGISYAADMADQAPMSMDILLEYARVIESCYRRREIIKITAEVSDKARDGSDTDLVAMLEGRLASMRVGKDELTMRSIGEVSAEVVGSFDRPEEKPLLKTGLVKLDRVIGGFEKGDLVLVAARPSMGKSALAGCIALNVAHQGFGVEEINGEMNMAQMTRRHLTDQAFRVHGMDGPEYRTIRQRKLDARQRAILEEANAALSALPIMMLKRTGLTLGQLRATCRRQKMKWQDAGIDLSLIIVDHVGLMKGEDVGRGYNRSAEQTMISGGLKEMADELDVVMLALAQLNRECEQREDKRPQLSDLRDSGSWEQDADIVIGVYRDAYYARREAEPKSAVKIGDLELRKASKEIEAILLKVREGDNGTARLWGDMGRNAIRDEDPDRWTPIEEVLK